MSKLSTAYRLLTTNKDVFLAALLEKISPFIPNDRLYLQWLFRFKMGYPLDLKNPKTFCEKLQWLKLYNRKDIYTTMVDKYTVKELVAGIIGNEYIIPTLGVWKKPEDIDWDSLPIEFVLKPTNGGGNSGVIICIDKNNFDKANVINILNRSVKMNIYAESREWPYKNVKARIIAEELLHIPEGEEGITDYKFYCFNGVVTYCQVIKDRSTKETIDFFDTNWNHMSFCGLNPKAVHAKSPILCPKNYDKMLEIAAKLSKDIPFLRVDLYNIDGKIYFGETTFYPNGGYGVFTPGEWNRKLGEKIKI